MEEIVWNYNCDYFVIHGCGDTFIRFGRNGIVFGYLGQYEVKFEPADIGKAYFEEPKLFKKGCILLQDEDGKNLHTKDDYPLFIELKKSERDTFYLFYSYLEENGVEVYAG